MHNAPSSLLVHARCALISRSGRLSFFFLCFSPWQFVLDVDELIFRVFCPRKLKLVLDDVNAHKLRVAAMPTYKGLDTGPLVKLLAATTMIALMAGTSILPMANVLYDAGDSLCGMRHAAESIRTLDA